MGAFAEAAAGDHFFWGKGISVPVGVLRTRLAGRSDELARVRAFYTEASAGTVQVLLVRGPAGIGKTTLLDATTYPGARVLRAWCRPAGHSAVRELLTAAETSPDVCLPPGTEATFSALSALYRPVAVLLTQGPLVLVLDDVHHCDELSLRWLDFLLRRAAGQPLFVLLAQVGDQPVRAGGALTEIVANRLAGTLYLEPLPEPAIAEIIAEKFGEPPDPAFTRRCAEVCGGNPALLDGLLAPLVANGSRPGADDAAQVAAPGGPAADASLTGLPGYVHRVARAIAILHDTHTERVALLAQVPPRLVEVAMRTLRHKGVLTVSGANPVAESFLDVLPDGELARLRMRAAQVLSDAARPVTDVAEQVMRLPALDLPWTRRVLREAAATAAHHGANADAARYLTRLLEARPDDVDVQLDLANALVTTDPVAALAHLEDVMPRATDVRTTARIAAQIGWASLVVRPRTTTVRVLDRALAALTAEVGDNPDLADCDLRTTLESVVAITGSNETSAIRTLRLRLATAPPPGAGTPAEQHVLAVRALVTALTGKPAEAAEDARRALSRDEHLPGGWSAVTASRVLFMVDDSDAALDGLNRATVESRRRNDAWTEVLALSVRGMVWLDLAEIDQAVADARAAIDVAARQPWSLDATLARLVLALARDAQSDVDGAEAALADIDVKPGPEALLEYHVHLVVKASLLTQRGDLPAAVELLRTCGRSLADAGVTNPMFAPWWLSGAMLLAMAGRFAEATEFVEHGERLSLLWDTARSRGMVLLAKGVVTTGPERIALLSSAMELLDQSPAKICQMQAEYFLGCALLDVDDKQARAHLRRAALLSGRSGYTALAVPARARLVEAGGRMPHATSRVDVLTGSERQVAELAARDVSNREISDSLFVTVRTVEFHLTNVYRKLGVSRRNELAAVLETALETDPPWSDDQ
ncbi:AAA family ATPase [Actinocrispum wychmicini]|uniref:ATP/maltotriose-dependent transcriptional regulator MalT n=1 Tax=Actinocrispum wychmicini TaxID=1213861 RepID=A0A4R2ILH2_9PSEU|nr:LuxR family transcriptional regulator [Actinocrispum wychmicini]TCO44768.1 ATP/maltotriose-dependent transcriptional regulator MalT [Actinocrispum wychmicini]